MIPASIRSRARPTGAARAELLRPAGYQSRLHRCFLINQVTREALAVIGSVGRVLAA